MKQGKAKGVLPREHTGHRKHSHPKHKRKLYTWTSPYGQHWNQIDFILCSERWWRSIQSARKKKKQNKTLGVNCGTDHELFTAKFRLKLKKVGKTTRWFRYDLNQIPYNYTVEVTSRFRQLDLMTEYLKNKDGGSDQDHPQEEEMQKGKMVAWGGLTSSWEQKRRERQRRKGKIHPFECRVCKEIDENNRMGKTRDIFKKVKDSKGTFHEKKGR